jgi:hypothetical protein
MMNRMEDQPAEQARTGAHDLERLFREEGQGVWRTICAFPGGRPDVADEVTAAG